MPALRRFSQPFAAVPVVAVLMAVAPSCGSAVTPPKEPEKCKLQTIDLSIIASGRINPTDSGEARPVQLRLYQLTTDVRLNNARFEDVWKDEKGTLKEDLVKAEELTIYPDSRTDVKFERDEKALYLGAVALFRRPTGRLWYTVLELPPAPGKGECFAGCPSGDCGDAGKAPTSPQATHFVLWLDGTKVDDGSDHLEDYPRSGRHVQMRLPFSSPDERERGKAQDEREHDQKPGKAEK